MSRATTIVFAREDLSIPGTPASSESLADHADAVQARFFGLRAAVISGGPLWPVCTAAGRCHEYAFFTGNGVAAGRSARQPLAFPG